ncbi:helix-turn-helix domain-containing protein [Pygmaiobacter massiliensis]|uniref:helix-turn-helix domain-containing protein n=1 Tax=Pygmaiobacter massiliensis TaxID=1917873 RepID=UPI000C7E5C88|nr:helix-turn-helix transcriptional regulator [Pygmaiobacter massiliensis]
MSAQWTAEIVGKMHVHNISQSEIAAHLGFSREYTNAVLNGKRNPKTAEVVFRKAIDELIAEKSIT